jgi:tRNA(Ile)-lysidine synthase
MMSEHPFEQRVAAAWPVSQWQDVAVIVAVSGGRDSVALLRALARLRDPSTGRLVVGHFNHGWRGAESDGDEAFVRRLCDELGLACEIGRAAGHHAPGHAGLEAAARRQRYQFLRKTADLLGARYVATAHTAHDQVETILHRVVRGTGLRGLAGIPKIRTLSPLTTVVRPLLHIHRAEIQSYLDDLPQLFREDSTNAATHHTRNRIRHQLLPALQRDYNPRVEQAVQRLGDLARQAQQVIDALVDTLRTQFVTPLGSHGLQIDCTRLRRQPPYLIRELLLAVWRDRQWPLQDMNERKWRELCGLIQESGGSRRRFTLPGRIDVQLTGDVMTCMLLEPRD